jgi:hypothetical protein
MTKPARVTITMEIVPDDCADASYLEQDDFEDRLEAYRRGDFSFVGVRAVAHIRVPYGEHAEIETTLKSPGLWGIEDDSGGDYFLDVFEGEKLTLLDMLKSLHNYTLVASD